MNKRVCSAAITLLALAGCSANQDQPAAEVASPSEGARVVNQNPSSPTIDVPNTPRNEAAQANADAAPAPADTGADAAPANPDSNRDTTPALNPPAVAPEPAPTTSEPAGGSTATPKVIENPSEPSPGVQGKSAPEK